MSAAKSASIRLLSGPARILAGVEFATPHGAEFIPYADMPACFWTGGWADPLQERMHGMLPLSHGKAVRYAYKLAALEMRN